MNDRLAHPPQFDTPDDVAERLARTGYLADDDMVEVRTLKQLERFVALRL